jgi:hypothetical protein
MNDIDFPSDAYASPRDPLVRKAIYYAFGGACFWSGREIPFDQMTLDHVVPKTQGGPDNFYNLVLSCRQVNRQKGERLDAVALAPVLYLLKCIYGPRAKSYWLSRSSKPRQRYGSHATYWAQENVKPHEASSFLKWGNPHDPAVRLSTTTAWLLIDTAPVQNCKAARIWFSATYTGVLPIMEELRTKALLLITDEAPPINAYPRLGGAIVEKDPFILALKLVLDRWPGLNIVDGELYRFPCIPVNDLRCSAPI